MPNSSLFRRDKFDIIRACVLQNLVFEAIFDSVSDDKYFYNLALSERVPVHLLFLFKFILLLLRSLATVLFMIPLLTVYASKSIC